MHRLWLTHTASLPEALQAAVLHADAVDAPDAATDAGTVLAATLAAPGEPGTPVVEPPPELVARLGRAYLRADVVVLSRTDPRVARQDLTGLFTGPEGSWSMVASPSSQTVTVRSETVAALRTRLAALAAAATTPATPTTGSTPAPEVVVS
jgi:hypothetical protein